MEVKLTAQQQTDMHHVGILERLRVITIGCRPDMHEPDEQEVSARLVGYHLNNAMGDGINEYAIVGGYQEYVVILERGNARERFNLADLIALARRARIGKAETGALTLWERALKGATFTPAGELDQVNLKRLMDAAVGAAKFIKELSNR